MKYIKTFENINKSFEVGDYVLIHVNAYNKDFEFFINNTIGQIVQIDALKDVFGKIYDYEIVVSYDNIPEEIKDRLKIYSNDYRRRFNMIEIVAAGKTHEEVLLKINANKYNL